MAALDDWLTIGDLAARSGVAASALRFYESRGLIASQRTEGNQRRFPRSTLRRVAVVRAARGLGLSLGEIQRALEGLPVEQTPNKSDWTRLSRAWRDRLDDRIADLEQLRDELTDCIGCGCLSLRSCALLNTDDRAGSDGSGARYLLGNAAEA